MTRVETGWRVVDGIATAWFEARPLRNRIHLDVVRPGAAVEQASPGAASGPYGVRHADADGNELVVVGGA